MIVGEGSQGKEHRTDTIILVTPGRGSRSFTSFGRSAGIFTSLRIPGGTGGTMSGIFSHVSPSFRMDTWNLYTEVSMKAFRFVMKT